MQEIEVWKDIPGYEGLYQVSNIGRIKSLRKDRILKLIIARNGYCRIQLCNNGLKEKLVHRLVYEAFIGSIPEKMCINHKDEDKTNNSLSNLELVTHAQNNVYGTRVERVRKKRLNGIDSKAVLQFDMQGNFIKEFPSMNEAQRQTGIRQGSISHCCNGRYNHAGGFTWRYKF